MEEDLAETMDLMPENPAAAERLEAACQKIIDAGTSRP